MAPPLVEYPDLSSFPPSYSEATRQHASLGGALTFADFLPYCIDPGGFTSSPKFEPFRVLVQRANDWLKENYTWEVKTCESVEFKASKSINVERMTYYEYGQYSTCYMRGLRLWLVPRLDQSRPAQQLGYSNLIPQQTARPGKFSNPTFETLQELLERYNNLLAYQPAPGRVLALETQEMKVPSYSDFDPDRSYWTEHGDRNRLFLFVIRVFYELGTSGCEEIGVADFVPVRLSAGGAFTMPTYEPFSNVISRAAQWCTQQGLLRFCNAQSLEIKLKSDPGQGIFFDNVRNRTIVDTQRMSYTEHGKASTFYARVLRVAYSKEPVAPLESGLPPSPPLSLHCKTFMPLPLSRAVFTPEFEGLSMTKKRVEAWIKATGARVLSCETAAMRLFTGGEAYDGVESSFTYNLRKRNEYWIFVLRIYLDGVYQEPPEELMPPVPEVHGDGCCVII